MLALGQLKGLVVIDEVQRSPDLFETLRVLVDKRKKDSRFLVLGSASRDLIKQSSETLAGRIQYLELCPFSLFETKEEGINRLWLRGGFPPSYLARNDSDSSQWLEAYVRTFLERDIPALGIQIPSIQMRRFWMMLSHYHGQILNLSEIGRSFGIADTTVRRYIDILSGAFMLRCLPAWFENISKRQVKSPKIFFRDSGIFHRLLGVNSKNELITHPKLGASWEGFALEEVIRQSNASDAEIFFWAIHQQADLDLLILKNNKRLGFEIKYTDSPQITKSMKAALEILKLDSLSVIYPGNKSFQLDKRIYVHPLSSKIIS